MSDQSDGQAKEPDASSSKTNAFVASSGFAIYELEFGIVEKKDEPKDEFTAKSYTEVVVCRVKEVGPKDIFDQQSIKTSHDSDATTMPTVITSATSVENAKITVKQIAISSEGNTGQK